MAHGVDLSMDRVQAPDCQPVLDLVLSHSDFKQMRPRDHAVLPPSHLRYARI